MNKFDENNLDGLIKLLEAGVDFLKRHSKSIILFAFLMFLSVIGFYTVRDIQSASDFWVALVFIFTSKFGTLVLSLIFLFAIYEIFYVITTRFWVSASIPTVLALGIAIADGIKMDLREEPVYPNEISEIVNWKTLIPMIGVQTLIYILVGIALLIAIIVYLELKHPHNLRRKKKSWLVLIGSLLILITPVWFNDENSAIYYISKGFDNNPDFRNPPDSTANNGAVLTFLDFIKVPIMEKVDGYSEHAIKQITKKYEKEAIAINKTRKNKLSDQTIVFNLSESFVDPKEFPGVKISDNVRDPMKYIRSLMSQTTSGKMLSAGYGGGTGNMEYESLTGFNMGNFSSALTPYTQVTSRYNFYPTIGMNFPYSSAIHPFNGTYYKSRKNGQFINLISMQNHMPYGDYYSPNEYKDNVSGSSLADDNVKTSFAAYTKGVEYTDKAVKKFIKEIDEINKPITLVFYGDHYPSIIDQSLLSKYPIKMHSTT